MTIKKLPPYKTSVIQYEQGRKFILWKGISCPIVEEGLLLAVTLITYAPLKISIGGVGRDMAIHLFAKEFERIWGLLAKADDKDLSPNGFELKQKLISMVKEVR